MYKRSLLVLGLIIILLLTGCNKDRQLTTTNTTNIKSENLIREDNHKFKFISNGVSDESINDIKTELERNYNRILKDFEIESMPPIIINVYPSVEKFHEAMNSPNSPNWFVGIAQGSFGISMVSPDGDGLTHSYDEILQVAVHEFTHCITLRVNSNAQKLPRWLVEGIALYEANQSIDLNKLDYLKKDEIPKLHDLNSTNPEKIGLVYHFGYSIIEFIEENWGMETVIELIRNDGNIKEVIGISETDFQNDWHKLINDKYLSK